MRLRLAAGILLCAASAHHLNAQGGDPKLMSEAAAVRDAVVRNNAALRQYSWIEHTEVLVKGDVKVSTDFACRYDGKGELTKMPLGKPTEEKQANALSKRHTVRKKSDMQDYIDRAITMIQTYVPLKPDEIQLALQNGTASLGPSGGGKSEILFKDYFKGGDSLVFTYDSASKALLKAAVNSNLGTPKDPVTLEALFETLPDGVNHLASATLNASAKKVQVRRTNATYQKVAN